MELEKMQDCLIDANWYVEEFLRFPKKVQELLVVNNISEAMFPSIYCENITSPIEQIFITAFELYVKLSNKTKIMLFSQMPIQTKNKKYIVDFLFKNDEYVNNFNTNKKIVIECDGYEFHQKSKEQVKRDNEREYDLKMEDYEVIRFSGSQIYNNPFKCAEQTYDYIMKKIKEE